MTEEGQNLNDTEMKNINNETIIKFSSGNWE